MDALLRRETGNGLGLKEQRCCEMQQAVVNSGCEGNIFSIPKSFNLDFSLKERNQGYINSDFNVDNSRFSEVLLIHYLVTDILFLLSQSKYSRK